MLLQSILIVRQVIFHVDSPKNIAKNEQNSHTSGGSHHRLTTLIGKKEKYTNEGTDKIFLYTVQLVIYNACTEFQNSR